MKKSATFQLFHDPLKENDRPNASTVGLRKPLLKYNTVMGKKVVLLPVVGVLGVVTSCSHLSPWNPSRQLHVPSTGSQDAPFRHSHIPLQFRPYVSLVQFLEQSGGCFPGAAH